MKPKVYDETKLPKWAQSRLENLRRNLRILNLELSQMESGETDTFFDPYFPETRNGRGLPLGTTVRFVYGMAVQSHIDIRLRDRELDISGGDRLVVYPQSSNHIKLVGHHL